MDEFTQNSGMAKDSRKSQTHTHTKKNKPPTGYSADLTSSAWEEELLEFPKALKNHVHGEQVLQLPNGSTNPPAPKKKKKQNKNLSLQTSELGKQKSGG